MADVASMAIAIKVADKRVIDVIEHLRLKSAGKDACHSITIDLAAFYSRRQEARTRRAD